MECKMKFKSQEEENLITVIFTILSNLMSPNIVSNYQGKILFANKAYKALSPKKPINEFFWNVFPLTKSIPSYFIEATEQSIETRSEITFKEMSFITRVIPVSNILVDETIYLIYFEDITSNVNLNKQLKYDKKLLQKSFLDSILAFSEFVESRDAYTSGHQKRVALLAMNIATKAKITDQKLISTIYFGALMHDIGKVAIPMEYLVTPRRLTFNEFEIIKTHVEIGNKIIEHLDFPWDIKSVVYQHHERLDGSGYPHGLKADQIGIPAKIVAIADAYDAMSIDRPYRKAIDQEVIFEYLESNKGTLFDSYYVECLFQCVADLKDIYEINPNFRPFDLIDF